MTARTLVCDRNRAAEAPRRQRRGADHRRSIAAAASPRVGGGCAPCAAAASRRQAVRDRTLPEAGDTLKRLRERQIEAQAADEALIEIDAAGGPLATAEKLAEQGFGHASKSTADDVLARLNAKRARNLT